MAKEKTNKDGSSKVNDFLYEVGQRIKYLRIEKGLTQDELAKKMGYTSRSTINKIEKGLVDMPFTKIKEFADIFGIIPQFFFSYLGRGRRLPGTEKSNKVTIKTVDDVEIVFSADNETVQQIVLLLKNEIQTGFDEIKSKIEQEYKQE